MSLLMEALKRAEENKQDAAKAITNAGAAPTGLKLEPLKEAPAAGAPTALPDLADHLEALDADLAASAGSPPPRPAAIMQPPAKATSPDVGRDAVRNAFASKEPLPPSRRGLWLALGLLGLAAAGIGGYVWYQVQGMSRSSLAPSATSPRSAAQPAPQPYVAPHPMAVPLPAAPSLAPSAATVERAMSASVLAQRRSEPPEQIQDSATPATPTTPVRLVRTRPEVDPNLGRGYHSLQAGKLDTARTDYEQALRRDPKNVDALLGLAAIAQREGRATDAERYWQQAFEADPKDAAAQAAVVGIAAPSDPVAAESRLKTLLAAQPESGPLNFTLGNLYSRQNRWAEAQQVYFNAVAADGDNPDYLFNLAISLDHLRQPKLAAQHYRLALEAAERRTGAFSREQAKKRLQTLQP